MPARPLPRTPCVYPRGSTYPTVFDAFLEHARSLVLVSTYYTATDASQCPPLQIATAQGRVVPLPTPSTAEGACEREPVRYWRVPLPSLGDDAPARLTVGQGDTAVTYALTALPLPPAPPGGHTLLVATLWKDEEERWVRAFLTHYRAQGASGFLLYYNGASLPPWTAGVSGDDVLWAPWNFEYWNPLLTGVGRANAAAAGSGAPFPHVAQMAFLTTVRLGALPRVAHALLCDIDEYVAPRLPHVPLADYLATDATPTVHMVANTWARIASNRGGRLQAAEAPLPYGRRTKCIYPRTFQGELGIHAPKSTRGGAPRVHVRQNDGLIMLHLVDVLHPDRRDLVDTGGDDTRDFGALVSAATARRRRATRDAASTTVVTVVLLVSLGVLVLAVRMARRLARRTEPPPPLAQSPASTGGEYDMRTL